MPDYSPGTAINNLCRKQGDYPLEIKKITVLVYIYQLMSRPDFLVL